MAATERLRSALTSFAVEGHFPDDIDSLPAVTETNLELTIQALEGEKDKLEVCFILPISCMDEGKRTQRCYF